MFRALLCVLFLSPTSVAATDGADNLELPSPQSLLAMDLPPVAAQAPFPDTGMPAPPVPPMSIADSGEQVVPAEEAFPQPLEADGFRSKQGAPASVQPPQAPQNTLSGIQLRQVEQLLRKSRAMAGLDQTPAVVKEASANAEQTFRFRRPKSLIAEPSRVLPGLRPVLMHRRSHHEKVAPLGATGEDDPEESDGDVQGSDLVDTKTRPGAKDGKVDIVKFGIFAKNFFGTNLKGNDFTIDAVLLLKWKDARAAKIVPAGMKELTMSGKQALLSVWMPEIVVTNRAIRKHEVVSSAVTISSEGDVTKVERFGAVINSLYDLTEYPFDTQKLKINIASSKYMLDELVMVPDKDKSASGVRDGLFKGFDYELKGWKIHAFKEVDGALKKSRGVLEIEAKRGMLGKWFEDHLTPTALLMIISWGVFYFPFQNPFITPRLALSIMVLLTFTNFAIKSASLLPPGIPTTWNDVFNQQVQALMFCTIVINILSEIAKHQYELNDLGTEINNGAKIMMPVLTIVLLTLVLTAGIHKWLSIHVTTIVAKTSLEVIMCFYLWHNFSQLRSRSAAKKAADAERKAGEDKTRLGGEKKGP